MNRSLGGMDEMLVGVAQLVEPRIVAPVVVGSIPIAHPSVSHTAPACSSR